MQQAPGPYYYHQQDWYFPVCSQVDRESTASGNPGTVVMLFSSGKAKSGFPANFFSRKRVCLFLERANAEGDWFFFDDVSLLVLQ